MPNIIRIRSLENEKDLNGIIIPVDKSGYTHNAKQVDIVDLKNFILSGFTGGTNIGTSGTSGVDGLDGVDGVDGTSGTTPCKEILSNSITIIVDTCILNGEIECDY